MKVYENRNVLDASRERVAMLFDNFDRICVSISGGKDSTVLLHLALQEAVKRGRKIVAFFLDQEAEYQATIDLIRLQMRLEGVIPEWFQVPLYLTNATSYSDYFLYAWGHGEQWIRPKEENSIHEVVGAPERFYEFFPWHEKRHTGTAYLVGLRAEEGVTRYRACTKHAGWNDLKWSTESDGVCKFYPIYDWGVSDVWKFIYEYNLPYNKIYDLQWMAGYSIYGSMRVSNLIHEKSFKCLVDLPRFEPETYDSLCRRVSGIPTAARYATEKLVFSNKQLPSHYSTWKEFRDFLIESIHEPTHKKMFIDRFSSEPTTESSFKKQVGQLLINDYENSRGYDRKADEKVEQLRERWRAIL
jgi:predicted phosphoadenosine phosphosulfate sulfurtransferase